MRFAVLFEVFENSSDGLAARIVMGVELSNSVLFQFILVSARISAARSRIERSVSAQIPTLMTCFSRHGVNPCAQHRGPESVRGTLSSTLTGNGLEMTLATAVSLL
jgi:hypothetical protein